MRSNTVRKIVNGIAAKLAELKKVLKACSSMLELIQKVVRHITLKS
jgi:hypothetical protein